MTYKTIVNPITNRKVSIYSDLGYNILRNYVIQSGGSTLTDEETSQLKASLYDDVTQDFKCPISMANMIDPVSISSGNIFERAQIVEHFKSNNTDPLTNLRVKNKNLGPNTILRNQIKAYMDTPLPTPEEKREYENGLNEEVLTEEEEEEGLNEEVLTEEEEEDASSVDSLYAPQRTTTPPVGVGDVGALEEEELDLNWYQLMQRSDRALAELDINWYQRFQALADEEQEIDEHLRSHGLRRHPYHYGVVMGLNEEVAVIDDSDY